MNDPGFGPGIGPNASLRRPRCDAWHRHPDGCDDPHRCRRDLAAMAAHSHRTERVEALTVTDALIWPCDPRWA